MDDSIWTRMANSQNNHFSLSSMGSGRQSDDMPTPNLGTHRPTRSHSNLFHPWSARKATQLVGESVIPGTQDNLGWVRRLVCWCNFLPQVESLSAMPSLTMIWPSCCEAGFVAAHHPAGDQRRAAWAWYGLMIHIQQGLVTVPFWVYWTSPYSSHYRPYT